MLPIGRDYRGYIGGGTSVYRPSLFKMIKMKNPYNPTEFYDVHSEHKNSPYPDYIYGITMLPYNNIGTFVLVSSLNPYRDDNIRRYKPEGYDDALKLVKPEFKDFPILILWWDKSKWSYVDYNEFRTNSRNFTTNNITEQAGDFNKVNEAVNTVNIGDGKYTDGIGGNCLKGGNDERIDKYGLKRIISEKGDIYLNDLFAEIHFTDSNSPKITSNVDDGMWINKSNNLNDIKKQLIQKEIPTNIKMGTLYKGLTDLLERDEDIIGAGNMIIDALQNITDPNFKNLKGIRAYISNGYVNFWRCINESEESLRNQIINKDGYEELNANKYYGVNDYITRALLETTVLDGKIAKDYYNNQLSGDQLNKAKDLAESVQLKSFDWQYNRRIEYDTLKYLLFRNGLQMGMKQDISQQKEAELILKQEYLISLQPDPKYVMWFLEKLLMLWCYDRELNHNIRRIKVLVNLYRANGKESFNKKNGVLPIIVVYPRYGVSSARTVLAKLKEYFPLHGDYAWDCSNPTYFVKDCNLFHYTNGALDIKLYYQNVIKTSKGTIIDDSFDPTFTKYRDTSNVAHRKGENWSEKIFK